MIKNFDMIYSVGADCACSIYMKKAALRSTSGPFDWITGASLEKRIDLICNNFDGFLNINNLTKMVIPSNGIRDNENDSYICSETNFKFFHDFKRDIDLNFSFNEVKEKYCRRINRFYKNIKKYKNVLFIYFSQDSSLDEKNILLFHSQLCEKFNKKIYFLFIQHEEDLEPRNIKYKSLNEFVDCYYLYTREYSEELKNNGGYTTLGRTEDILPIFMKYSLKRNVLNCFCSKTIKLFGKIVSCFIPIKETRKKVRNYFNSIIYKE